MALTQSAWSVKSSQSGRVVATSTVAVTTAEHDAYTLALPKEIDLTRPFTVNLVCSATPDGQALPVDIWIGFTEAFALTGDDSTVAPLVAGTGAKFKQILDDCVLAVTPLVYSFLVDPNLAVADVVTVAAIATGLKTRFCPAVKAVINLNGGSTLAAQTCTFTVIQ